MVRHFPPYCVQIELTEGCPLRCEFCGLQGIRGKLHDYQFMSAAMASVLAGQLKAVGWTSRIEFAMHGEPTANPHWLERIVTFRRALPNNYFLMETNGFGLAGNPRKTVAEAFGAGLNTIAVDEYEGVSWANRIRGALKDREWYYEYPAELEQNPHHRKRGHRLIVIAPINKAASGSHSRRKLNNHCGAAALLATHTRHWNCAKPVREISVRWDGKVSICCNDWRGVFKAGDTAEASIESIWLGPLFSAARRKLLHRQRDFPPCIGCTADHRFQAHLGPGKWGKVDVPEPDAACDALLAGAVQGLPLAQIVLRPWEAEGSSAEPQMAGRLF